MTWIEAAKQVDLAQCAIELELGVHRGGHLSPCPACGESTRSANDTRLGPIYLTQGGSRWACGRCNARGDAVDLVAFALTGRKLDRDGSSSVRSWYAARGWCEPATDRPVEAPVRPRPTPKLELLRDPAPREEVEDLWTACDAVTDVPAARDWIASRGLDPTRVEDRQLARALPASTTLPRWAQHWVTSHPCPVVVPLFDTGGIVGLQGRRVDGAQPKSVAARGVARHGLYACGWGQRLLRGEVNGWVGDRIIIAEGEPDWLTWSSWVSEAEDAPIVFGLPGDGSWTETIASAVATILRPHIRVLVRTHDDAPGHKYAREIHATLRAYPCQILVRQAPAARGESA